MIGSLGVSSNYHVSSFKIEKITHSQNESNADRSSSGVSVAPRSKNPNMITASTLNSDGTRPNWASCGTINVTREFRLHSMLEQNRLRATVQEFFVRFHQGTALPGELNDVFQAFFDGLMKLNIELGLTDGNCPEFKARVLADAVRMLRSENLSGAYLAQEKEGEKLANRPRWRFFTEEEFQQNGASQGGVERWNYFNAMFFFQEREMLEKIMEWGGGFAKDNGLTNPRETLRLSEGLNENLHFNDAIVFRRLSGGFRFPDDFRPTRDFSKLHDIENHMLTINGVKFCMFELHRAETGEELKAKMAERGVELKHLMFARFVSAQIHHLTESFVNTKLSLSQSAASRAYSAHEVFAYKGV